MVCAWSSTIKLSCFYTAVLVVLVQSLSQEPVHDAKHCQLPLSVRNATS